MAQQDDKRLQAVSAAESGAAEENFFVKMEHDVLQFWQDENCFEKLREQNKNGRMFRFVDGPITANSAMGIHHAWGRSMKDMFIRYHALQGCDCRYQNGFDAQGLWVEVEVEKELGFQTKQDIEQYGIDRFTHKCVERVEKYAAIITEQSRRLGQWMDWSNSYYTHTDENIQGIWYFLKKCHENNWLRQEFKPMPWCPRCGTSLSEHEMTGSYKLVTHDSVFCKLPLADGRKLLVWTTTPWTLSSNVALAVNPEIDYAEVRVKSDDTPLILAKNAIGHLGEDKQEVLRVFKGAELVGLSYETCFPEFEKLQGIDYRVVAWEDVDAAEGVGVVHIAPGCGLEDFALGTRLGLAQPMPVDDVGIFLEGFGFMSGKDSHNISKEVFTQLSQRGKLYKVQPYEHSYPVCWRCKSEVIFRLVPAWYIATQELKPRLLCAAESVKWEPESGGKRMADWLNNMGDWNISRKRYYGMPLPFYPCPDCGELTVVGSREELRELGGEAVDRLPELHRPWIDEIRINCPKCGAKVARVSEIGDVWLDAGIVPFTTLGYFKDKAYWQRNFPAEWITEMSEQIRLWFYSMLFMSVVLEDRAPYERVLAFAPVVQEDGSKFSKTGFKIEFNQAAERMGADTIRYMYAGTPYANDVRFGYNLGDEARRKLLSFWNVFTFFTTYANIDKPNLETFELNRGILSPNDRWLLLRTNTFIDKATASMDAYKTFQLVREFESFVEDVSNWYIRTNRRRFWKAEDETDKMQAYYVLFFALNSAVRIMSPVLPFMTEHIWQSLTRKVLPSCALSVHMGGWPQKMENIPDGGLLADTALAREVIAVAMRLRNEQQLKVRQPLQTLYLCGDAQSAARIRVFEKNILDELNVKELRFIPDMQTLMTESLGVNFKAAGAVLKQDVNKFKAVLEAMDAQTMADLTAQYAGGTVTVPGWETPFDASLFLLQQKPKTGVICAQCGDELSLALDTNLTRELRKEGAVRDIVRQCQLLRKEAGYSVEQRIQAAIVVQDAFLLDALQEQRTHIAAELLAQTLLFTNMQNADLQRDIQIAGMNVNIAVTKA